MAPGGNDDEDSSDDDDDDEDVSSDVAVVALVGASVWETRPWWRPWPPAWATVSTRQAGFDELHPTIASAHTATAPRRQSTCR